MPRERLKQLFERSQNWVDVRTESELADAVRETIIDVIKIRSGFFVWRRAGGRNHVEAGWGVFSGREASLQTIVEEIEADFVTSVTETYRTAGQVSSRTIRDEMDHYGIRDVGLWSVKARRGVIGFIVVAYPIAPEMGSREATDMLMDACVAQMAMACHVLMRRRMSKRAGEYDPLTGLLNRRGLKRRAAPIQSRALEHSLHVIFGIIDVDGLKDINDSEGHPKGDRVIQEIAKVIRGNIRARDLACRYGGDEFVVLCESESADAQGMMKRIQEAVATNLDGLSVSVGGAVWGVDGNTLEECYQVADGRLYECKARMKK